jgi:hypothetical protein
MCLTGPLLVAMGLVAGYLMMARLALPWTAGVVPCALAVAGVLVTIRVVARKGRMAPRVPWIAIAAVTVAYAGILLWVMPALERQKVVPDLARWVAAEAKPEDRVAGYRLNRWSTAFRFYVNRHVEVLETAEEAVAFFDHAGDAYCAMLEPAYDELVAHGMPLKIVQRREGLWATSGRALWRQRLPPTRFVIVTRR